jgi:hypothetical protein
MHAVSIRSSFVALFAVYAVLGCGSSTTSGTGAAGTGGTGGGGASGGGDPTAFGNTYKISDNVEMPGWTQDPTTPLWTGRGTDLSSIIDGGNVPYLQHGCLLAMYQSLVGPDPQICTLVAMDFGTAANATSMFTYEQQLTSADVPIPGYDASVAIGYSVLAGITAYAHINASYFEVQLSGYTDNASAAQVAAQFLNVMKTKTK